MPAEPLNLITQEEPNSAKGLTELVGGSFPRQDFGSDPVMASRLMALVQGSRDT